MKLEILAFYANIPNFTKIRSLVWSLAMHIHLSQYTHTDRDFVNTTFLGSTYPKTDTGISTKNLDKFVHYHNILFPTFSIEE